MENPLVISDEGSNELIFRFNTEDSKAPWWKHYRFNRQNPSAVEVVTDDLDSAKLITFTASDELSGINKASVSVKKTVFQSLQACGKRLFFYSPRQRVYTIEVLDNAGNMSEPVEIEITPKIP